MQTDVTTKEVPLLSRRMALLAVLSLPLADVRVLARQNRAGETVAPGQGHLTIPLDQWRTLRFTLKGKMVELTTAEVFAVLKGTKA